MCKFDKTNESVKRADIFVSHENELLICGHYIHSLYSFLHICTYLFHMSYLIFVVVLFCFENEDKSCDTTKLKSRLMNTAFGNTCFPSVTEVTVMLMTVSFDETSWVRCD